MRPIRVKECHAAYVPLPKDRHQFTNHWITVAHPNDHVSSILRYVLQSGGAVFIQVEKVVLMETVMNGQRSHRRSKNELFLFLSIGRI